MSYQPIDKFKKQNWFSRIIYNRPWVQKPKELTVDKKTVQFQFIPDFPLVSQFVTVKNTGYLPLHDLDIQIVGDFIVTHDAPATLLPDAEFTFSISPNRVNASHTGGIFIGVGSLGTFVKLSFLGSP